MKNIRIFVILIIITVIYLTVNVNSAFVINETDEIIKAYKNEDLVRLHVVANSNSPQDQYLKRFIRDKILVKISNYKDKGIREENIIKEIEEYVEEILEHNNAGYPAVVSMGNYNFPRRSYGNITLPEGNYKALRIILGAGKGSNWWCVLFPPLCINGKKIDAEEDNIIAGKSEIKFRLKINELIDNGHNKLVEFRLKSALSRKGKFLNLFQSQSESS